MASGDPDLNLLVALRALLEEANVTHAGERIGVGQSTMSAALSRLRTLFQDELLVRVGRDYELTPLARQILPQVQLTLPLVAQALGQDETFDPAVSRRTFTVQLTDYSAIELRPLFALANTAAPGIRFDLPRLPTDPVGTEREMLAHDFAVAPPGIGIEAESIDLFRDPYVVVADRDNPLVQDGRISIEDFLRSPLIRCDFGRGHLTPAERRMREVGALPPVRVTTSTMLAIPLIVGGGTDLIGVVPRRLAERNRAVTHTVAVPTPFPEVELIQRLWWHPAHHHDEGHAWFRRLAAEVAGSGALRA